MSDDVNERRRAVIYKRHERIHQAEEVALSLKEFLANHGLDIAGPSLGDLWKAYGLLEGIARSG